MTGSIPRGEGSRPATATPPAQPIRVWPLWLAPLPGRKAA
jgi:hypothetical protein